MAAVLQTANPKAARTVLRNGRGPGKSPQTSNRGVATLWRPCVRGQAHGRDRASAREAQLLGIHHAWSLLRVLLRER